MASLTEGKRIVERIDMLRMGRSTFDTEYQSISDHILGRHDFTSTNTPGRPRMQQIYDTTGLTSGYQLAGALHGLVTNPSSRWFELPRTNAGPSSDADTWLDVADRTMLNTFADSRSGFTSAIAEAYVEHVFFGTADVFVEDRPARGILFHSIPLSQFWIDESETGEVDSIFRAYKLSGRNASAMFGDELRKLPTGIQRDIERNPTGMFTFLHVVHPRREGGPQNDRRPLRSVHVEESTGTILRESGYWTMPHNVARWSRDPGELYGRGPGFQAKSDCMMLNEMGRVLITANQLAIEPPIIVPDDDVMSSVDLSPNGQTVVRSDAFLGRASPIQVLNMVGPPGITIDVITQRQAMVRSAFFSDLISARADPRLSATQFVGLDANMSRMLMATINRLESEMIEPMLVRTLDVLERSGRLPPRPPELVGVDIRPRFLSPVSRANRASEAQAILSVFADGGQLAAIDPGVLDNMDSDAAMRALLDARVVPPEIVRSSEERDDIRRNRAQRELDTQAQESFAQGVQSAAAAAPLLQGAAQGNA